MEIKKDRRDFIIHVNLLHELTRCIRDEALNNNRYCDAYLSNLRRYVLLSMESANIIYVPEMDSILVTIKYGNDKLYQTYVTCENQPTYLMKIQDKAKFITYEY